MDLTNAKCFISVSKPSHPLGRFNTGDSDYEGVGALGIYQKCAKPMWRERVV